MIEINKVTKVAALVTTVGMLIIYKFFPGPVFLIVPMIVLILFVVGIEKIGIIETGERLQNIIITAIVAAVVTIIII